MSTKYYTSGGVVVTAVQRAAAQLMRKRISEGISQRNLSDSLSQIADAKPRKGSDSVSTNSIVYARELEINAATTVSDLSDLIDLPYRATKHAKLSIIPGDSPDPYTSRPRVLRLEWHGGAE